MNEITTKLYRLIRIAKWYFSPERKVFKTYTKRFENLEPFSDSDVAKFKEVATLRKEVFS